ncbi:MAG: N-acetyltransferase [Puniceicoccaceae bacterium]
MKILSECSEPGQWASLSESREVPCVPAAEWDRLSPDQHLVLHDGNRSLARCSVWTDTLPEWEGTRPGAIGHFDAVDRESGKRVLDAALRWLRARGKSLVVGPVNGNTWNPYRLVTKSDGRPPFAMEPAHPPFYTDLWKSMGFRSAAAYLSAEVPLELPEDPRLERTIRRLQAGGVRIRNLDAEDYENELRRIHSVSCAAFAGNFFYTGIGEGDFLALYAPYRERLNPGLVFLAEKQGDVVGFLFGVPDWAQASRGEAVDTVVYKTVAVLPKRELAGLGLWLSHRGHAAAADLGFRRVVHALMTSQSRLGNLNWGDVDVFREYGLFAKRT